MPATADIDDSVAAQVIDKDPKSKFNDAGKAIVTGVTEMNAANADFRILLYQGPVELARLIPRAKPDPKFNVILCLSKEDDPPLGTEFADKNQETLIVRLGHKAKYVGVVGVFKTGNPAKPFDLHYQAVPMLPEWDTPPALAARQPIVALLQRYKQELKDNDYLTTKYGKIVPQMQVLLAGNPKFAKATVKYVGSEACKGCHKSAFAVWKGTPHASAYADLAAAKFPSLNEYDPECIVCHTVGYRYTTGFQNAVKTPKLTDVGCECCHGPGSLHVADKGNRFLRQLMNPWKAPKGETEEAKKGRLLRIQTMCRDCHDEENDVHWEKLETKWDKIEHPTPPKEREAPDDDD